MNYRISKEMLARATKLINGYTAEYTKNSLVYRIINRKENRETLKAMSIAISGLMLFMTDYDKSLLIEEIHKNKIDNKIIRAIAMCKKDNNTFAIA